jgi:hypothetical protein
MTPWRLALLLAGGAAIIAGHSLAATLPRADCRVPEEITSVSGNRLATVESRVRAGAPLRIVVIGTASSIGVGANRAESAYPERLQAELARRLPKLPVTVLNKSKLHQTAAEMVARLPHDIIAERPALVIWQTGTVDAVRRVESRDFAQTLASGIDMLAEQRIDLILINPQYSPHTEMLVNFRPYLDDMQLLAQSHDILLFPRYAILRYWNDEGRFGPDEGAKEQVLKHSDSINACIADLLAGMIDSASTPLDLPATAPTR